MKILRNMINFNPFRVTPDIAQAETIYKRAVRILLGAGKTQVEWFLDYITQNNDKNKAGFLSNIVSSYKIEFPRSDLNLYLGVFDYLTLSIPLLLKLLIERAMLPLIANIRKSESFGSNLLNYIGFSFLRVLRFMNELLYGAAKIVFFLAFFLPVMLGVYIAEKISNAPTGFNTPLQQLNDNKEACIPRYDSSTILPHSNSLFVSNPGDSTQPQKAMLAIGSELGYELDIRRFGKYCKNNNMRWLPNETLFLKDSFPSQLFYKVNESYHSIISRFMSETHSMYKNYIAAQYTGECFNKIMIDRCVLNFFLMDTVFSKLPAIMFKEQSRERYSYQVLVDKLTQVLLFESLLARLEEGGDLIVDTGELEPASAEFINLLSQHFESSSLLGEEEKLLRCQVHGSEDGLEKFRVFKGFKSKQLIAEQGPTVLKMLPEILQGEAKKLSDVTAIQKPAN